ncbi:site-specific integrase [Streptococcus suis]|nr:site-specific integrase [Streptococcus suis]NQN95529.1 site-specific integrase [Streptococcus suis]NQO33052.1 site-specific integrase [Streptococcus suis]NQO43408.1 site-specific integrase [Streptococcus suis]NQO53976.1 site-specific integrase [Streptococcus suis]
MRKVEPIRDVDDIERMKDFLFAQSHRNYILIMCGLYSGLRISDIVKLQVRDVLRDHIEIVEQKTGKSKTFAINNELRKALDKYIKDNDLKSYDYLFPSRKRVNSYGLRITHIGRVAAYQIFKTAANHIGLYNIGTHTMRKTFGYHFYKKTQNIVLLMEIFNHASPDITLRYIGYKQDELDKAMLDFSY